MTRPDPYPTANEIAAHAPWMRRLALGLVGDPAAADDVVQDAWLRVAGSIGGEGRTGGPRIRSREGYLAAVVRSLALRRRRSELRRARREQRAARPEALPSTSEVAARLEVARRVAQALEDLEEPYRTTIVLRYHEDLSAAEIARRAGIPASTVRARLKRGLDAMRARLDHQHEGRASWVRALLPLARAEPGAGAAAAAFLGSSTSLLAMKLVLGASISTAVLALVWIQLQGGRAPASSPARPALALPAGGAASSDSGHPPAIQGPPREVAAAPTQEATPAPSSSRARLLARALTWDGRPVPDAWLRLAGGTHPEVLGDLEGNLALALPAAELERIAAAQRARAIRIEVGGGGRATRRVSRQLEEGATLLELGDIVLEPGGAVHGRVVDETGLGVEGALVAFGAPLSFGPGNANRAERGPGGLELASRDGSSGVVIGSTGPGGAYRLAGLPLGHGSAWARTDSSFWTVSEPIAVLAAWETPVPDLVLRDGRERVIAGRVLDPDGAPVPHLRLDFWPSASSMGYGFNVVPTGADGRFHFVPRQVEEQEVLGRAPSWEWEDLRASGVSPGTQDLTLVFERSSWLRVVVLDEQGRAIQSGRVTGVAPTGPDRALQRSETTLGPDGYARLRRPAQPLRVRVEAPGYRDALLGPFDVGELPDPLVVTLVHALAIVGQVLLPDGSPAAGSRVSLHRGAMELSGRAHLTHQGWSGDREAFVYALRPGAAAETLADGEGRFRLPLPGADVSPPEEVEPAQEVPGSLGGLGYLGTGKVSEPGSAERRWYVHAGLEHHATTTVGPLAFDATRDAELELVLPESGAIAGRLVLEDGRSPRGWTARASDALAHVAEAAVAPDGSFHLEGLHAGGWQVRAFEPGASFSASWGTMMTARTPEADVEVLAGRTTPYEHRASGRLRARLRGQLQVDGAPPGPWTVSVATTTPQAAIDTHRASLDIEGRFEVMLWPGLQTSISLRGGLSDAGEVLTIEARIEVLPGENPWSFDLVTASIEGVVGPSERAEPAAGMRYEAEQDGVTLHVGFTPNGEGRFGPLRVPAGRGILRRAPEFLRSPGPVLAELDLEPGEARSLTLP